MNEFDLRTIRENTEYQARVIKKLRLEKAVLEAALKERDKELRELRG